MKKFSIYNLQFTRNGFTLIELLVTVSIIAILMGLTILGLLGARQSSRNVKRKNDLEGIRAALELYKSDCKKYPTADIFAGSSLKGDGSLTTCPTTNAYLSAIPKDPNDPEYSYKFVSDGITYKICSQLEGLTSADNCDGLRCASGTFCNYKVTSP
jgi:general secretion pathway protein G